MSNFGSTGIISTAVTNSHIDNWKNNEDSAHTITIYLKNKGESHFSVLPLPLSFARSRESKGCPNSGFDRGVRGR